ncbi:MAG: aldo/keto reductase [Bryobacteraceae bacterium]|nr:aldo/keto reductase [Bryobacteraceae bacterium]
MKPILDKLCLGTMTFGSQVSEADSHRMLDRWLDRGLTFVDTANVYNAGVSEEILGRWFDQGAKRNRVTLATKVRGKMGDGPLDSGLSRAAIEKQIDDSLRRLRTDHVDLYYLHMPDPAVEIEESLETMDALVRAGKVREVAASNYAAWQMVEMHSIAAKRAFAPIRVTQPMYNVIARGIEAEYLPMCKRYGIATVVYNPLAGGLLTGKHGAIPEAGGRFDGNRMYLDRYWHEATLRAVEHLKTTGRPLVSLALNWLEHHSAADSIILGASRIEQLEANLRALDDGPLTEDELRVCGEAWAMVRGSAPQYNR